MTKPDIKSEDEGHSSERTGRLMSERQLPYVAPVCVRENVFDGREENFDAWRIRLTRRFGRIKLLHTLLRTPEEEEYYAPRDGDDDAKEKERKEKVRKREEEDIEALDEIVLSVNNEVLNKIASVRYAKEAMDTLARTFQKHGTNAVIRMRGRLNNLPNRSFETLGELFDEYDAIIRQLDRMNAMITDDERLHALLLAVPPALNHVVAASIGTS